MIKRKMAPNGGGGGSQSQAKNKRQKLSTGGKSQKQQATGARRQQNQSGANNQNQTEEPVWIYGLINNIEQMLSHLNAANNNQRLKEAVQQQQLLGAVTQNSAAGGRQVAANGIKSAKQANRSRPSNNSSGYSTPSSLYSTASLSPPFSSSSLAHCAYSSSSSSNSPISAPGAAQSPRQQQQQQQQSTATTTTATTNQKTPATNNKTSQQKQQQQQQQQILPRSPLSRQIKFHEYKGPPQTRRPNNQQKQAQTGPMQSAGQDSKLGFIQVEPIEQQQLRPQPIDCVEFGTRQNGGSLQTSTQQIRLNPMPMATTATCNQQANSLQTQVAVLAPMSTAQQHQQCKPTPNGPANRAGYQMGPGDSCGQMMIVSQQPVQQINQTTNYLVQPNAPSQPQQQQQQRQHVSLQLIRGADGQQQQVIVLDAVAFQQMQQQQQQQQRTFDQKQQQNSIILLQQEPMRQPDRGYNAPLAAAAANSGDDNNFQMHQTHSNAFMVETSNCLSAGEGQFQDDFLSQLEEETANAEVYYREQNHQHHHQQQPVRATALRHQARGHQLHFDAGQCQRGPISEGTSQTMSNYLQSNQFEQAPLQQPQAQFYATQEQLYAGANCNPLGSGVQLDYEAPDDTSEIEPTISFDGDLDHGMMYSEFIDSQDIPLNVDESDWLKKFLPPCTSS